MTIIGMVHGEDRVITGMTIVAEETEAKATVEEAMEMEAEAMAGEETNHQK